MSCKTQQKSEPEKTLAQQLEERMDSLYKKGYMAGHQDDPFYGIGWAYEDGKSDVKLTAGACEAWWYRHHQLASA